MLDKIDSEALGLNFCSVTQIEHATCNDAISACEKGGRWQLALSLLAELGEGRVQNSTITCNAATGACEKGGQWQLALGLSAELGESTVQPHTITCNAAISACEKRADGSLH